MNGKTIAEKVKTSGVANLKSGKQKVGNFRRSSQTFSENLGFPAEGDAEKVKTELDLYFIRAGDFVKIGRTSNLTARLVSIQTGCPFKIGEVVVVGGAGKSEREIHRRLAVHHSNGEWFRWCEAVEREIWWAQEAAESTRLALEYLTEFARSALPMRPAPVSQKDQPRE